MRFGSYVEGSRFSGLELCVSQPRTVDLTNKLQQSEVVSGSAGEV